MALLFNIGQKKVDKYYRKQAFRQGNIAIKRTPLAEKKFVIVIPSYNNAAFVYQNLSSALSQNYQNYEVVFINDASTDKTLALAKEITAKSKNSDKVRFINNTSNKGALYNIYHAVHYCDDSSIIVLCDGDDWLSGPNVLAALNAYYANSNVWLTWGNFLEYPTYASGLSRPVTKKTLENRSVRKQKWCFSHLKTFYVSLFKKIAKHDLMHNKTFYKVCYDNAIMFPMLEMAGAHAYFIQEVLYVYNRQTPLSDDKIHLKQQLELAKVIRQKPCYKALSSL